VPDALSHLSLLKKAISPPTDKEGELEICAYAMTLIKISDDFKEWMKKAYTQALWKDILDLATRSDSTNFSAENSLLYHTNPEDSKKHLCISQHLEDDIFRAAHDNQAYIGFNCCYTRIKETYYV
jgi:hypothetical protein